MFWIFLLEIPTGAVADYLGRKASILAGLGTAAAGVLVYASYPSFAVFLLGEVILAISFTLLSGADEALAYDSLVADQKEGLSKKVLSRMESCKLAGILTGAITGGLIAGAFSVRAPMLLQWIPFVLGFLIALTLREPEREEKRGHLTFSGYRALLTEGIRYFAGHKILKTLTLDMVLVSSLTWMIIWFYQALLIAAGTPLSAFGVIHAGMSVAQIVIIAGFPLLERVLGQKKRLLFLGAFLTGIFFVVISVATWEPLLIGGIILAAGFGLSRGPLFSSYMNKHIPSDKRATALSTSSMLRTLAIVVINLSSGLLAGWSVPGTMMILGIVIIIFSLVFTTGIREDYLLD